MNGLWLMLFVFSCTGRAEDAHLNNQPYTKVDRSLKIHRLARITTVQLHPVLLFLSILFIIPLLRYSNNTIRVIGKVIMMIQYQFVSADSSFEPLKFLIGCSAVPRRAAARAPRWARVSPPAPHLEESRSPRWLLELAQIEGLVAVQYFRLLSSARARRARPPLAARDRHYWRCATGLTCSDSHKGFYRV